MIVKLTDLLVIDRATFDEIEDNLMDGLKCIRTIVHWLENEGKQENKASIIQLENGYKAVKDALNLMPRPK